MSSEKCKFNDVYHIYHEKLIISGNIPITIWNLAPFTVKDFTIRTLADRIKDLPQLINLYPQVPKHNGLRKILLQNRRQRWVACWVEFMLSTLYFTDQDFLSVIVQHLQPLNGNDLKIRSAPHRILDTIDLKIVFPAQPKIKAFQKYIKGKGFYMYFKHWLNVCSFILS